MYEKCKVFIVTGREGTPEIIAATKKWLAKHDIIVDDLFFRPVKDYSPGAVLGFITLFIVPAAPLWAFSIGLLLVTTDRLIEVNKYNNERRRISQEA